MTSHQWLVLVVVLATGGFLWETYLRLRNARRFDAPLPDNVRDIFDPQQYRKSMAYKKARFRLEMFKSVVSFAIILGLLLTGGFGYIYNCLGEYVSDPMWHNLAYFGLLYAGGFVLALPFDVYDVFVIEEKFGFNRRTPKIFIIDQIKSFVLTLMIGGFILGAILWFYRETGKHFWIWAWLLVSGFSLLMSMLYTDLIVPLFNRLTPLPDGELRQTLEQMARRAGFALRNIYVMDAGKRSTKANAYFSGLGPRKRIVLFDTLIDSMEPAQIAAVLAHEIGHYKHRHIIRQVLLSVAVTGLTFYLLSLFLENQALARALGAREASFAIGLTAFALLYEPLSVLTGWLSNALSRRFEFQADTFAARQGYAASLAAALRRLASENLSNLTPDPLYVRFHYSHPPLHERLKHLENAEK